MEEGETGGRFLVRLEHDAYIELLFLAYRERRRPGDQAGILLTEVLARIAEERRAAQPAPEPTPRRFGRPRAT